MNTDSRIAGIAAHRETLIARHGWMVQSVFPTQDQPGLPFAYTIGLHDKGSPELISIGLPREVGHQLLNDVAKMLLERIEAGVEPPQGKMEHPRWPMPFFLLPATPAQVREWATGAVNRSEGQAAFLQVCWPDKAGRFPWEPRFQKTMLKAQPVLGAHPPQLH